ncbi:acyl-CoA N-acyltransferase [Boletus coccyginus]|nr:acyl-CoA N-acyltransferase [Boletus coccyginus]
MNLRRVERARHESPIVICPLVLAHGQLNDLVKLLTCNLHNIPENYYLKFWESIILNWPDLSFLAEDENGKVVGYVLSSIEPDESEPYVQMGQINSLSVLRPYRRLGIAQRLMNLSKDAIMRDDTDIECIQLHVRKSNRAALSLYNKLGYRYHHTESKYYDDDGEDAFIMRLQIHSKNPELQERPRSVSYIVFTAYLTHDIRTV